MEALNNIIASPSQLGEVLGDDQENGFGKIKDLLSPNNIDVSDFHKMFYFFKKQCT